MRLPSIFKPTISRAFAPQNIRLSDLYSFSTDVNEPSASVKKSAEKILTDAGYNKEEIRKIIYQNRELSVSQMKEIVSHLHEGGVFGFETSAGNLVSKYLHHEAIKKYNLGKHTLNLAVEVRKEPLNNLEAKMDNLKKQKQKEAKKKPPRYPF